MFDRLLDALRASRAAYTEIRAERAWTTVVGWRGNALIGAQNAEESGACVRALSAAGGWGIASASGLDGLSGQVASAHELALAVRPREPIHLAPLPARELEACDDLTDDVRGVSLGEKVALLRQLVEDALQTDRRLVDNQAVYADEVTETWYVNSEGTRCHALRTSVRLGALAVVQDAGLVARAGQSVDVRGGWRRAQGRESLFAAATATALEHVTARPFRSGRLPIVIDQRLAGVLAMELVGRFAPADIAARDGRARRFAVGQRLGSERITIGDDGSALGLRATLPFDDEGSPGTNTLLVQNGEVVGHLHTRETAGRAGAGPTGNARARTWRHGPVAAPTNLYIAAGSGERDALLRDVRLGVYLADAQASRLLPRESAIVAGSAWMIRDGAIAEPVRGVVLAGVPGDLLTAVEAVGGDFRWHEPAGGVRRGAQYGIPVAIGAPHLRLSPVELRGQAT